MKKFLASFLSASVLICAPGPLAYQALAASMEVPGGGIPLNNPGGLGAAGAVPGRTGELPGELGLPASELGVAPISDANAISGANPSAAAGQIPATAAPGSQADKAVPGHGAAFNDREPSGIGENPAPAGPIQVAQAIGNLGVHGGAAFDASLPRTGEEAAAVPTDGSDQTPPTGLAPAAAGGGKPVSGVEPKGPTREFWMGWKTELRHYLFRKKLLIEPFKLHWNWPLLPQWFGDGLRPYLGKYAAPAVGDILGSLFSGVWVLYSNVIFLRKSRLFGTRYATVEAPPTEAPSREHMSSDGSGVESDPNAGRVGTAMSHSVPLDIIRSHSGKIDPRVVRIADALLNRDKFLPARGVSSHFGVHVQRKPVHGLFRHDLSETERISIPLPAGRTLDGKNAVVLERTRQAPNKKPGFSDLPVHLNMMPSSWHVNEMYGPDKATTDRLRSHVDGKMRLEADGLPPLDPRYTTPDGGGIYDFGNNENMSVPLAIQQILTLHAHNRFAEALKRHFTADAPPAGIKDKVLWRKHKREFEAGGDEWLFQKARINMSHKEAEIHTNDWTPLLLPNPVTSLGLHMDWAGVLGLKVKKLWYTRPAIRKSFVGAILRNDLLSGVPGSPQEEWVSEYDMGETFSLVYLLRDLMRDKYPIYSYKTGELLAELDLSELVGPNIHKVMKRFSQADLWYSMGIVNPGDAVHNNIPNALRKIRIQKKSGELKALLQLKDAYGRAVRSFGALSAEAKGAKQKLDAAVALNIDVKDLAITDLVRAEERKWPTYVELLASLDLPVPTSFLELTGGDAELASILDDVYDGDLSKVHAHIGIRVAPRPPGFVLSLVSFMLFSQKAPERLKGNWFMSEGFTPEMNTEFGMDWQLSGEESKEMLLADLPELAPALDGKTSMFQEWNRIHPQTDAARAAQDYVEGVVTHTMGHVSGMGPLAYNRLYRNAHDPGAIPDGISNGKALFMPATRLGALLGWIASFIWQGKAFDRTAGGLKNRIAGILKIIPASVAYGESWFDGQKSIIIDYKGKAWWPLSLIRDEIRQVGPNVYIGYAYVRLFGRRVNILRFALDFTPPAPAVKAEPVDSDAWQDQAEALIHRLDRRAGKLWRAAALILPLAFLAAAATSPSAWLAVLVLPPLFVAAAVPRSGAALHRHKTGVAGLLKAFDFVLQLEKTPQEDAARARREKFALEELRYLNNAVEPAIAGAGRRSLVVSVLGALSAAALSYYAWAAVNPTAALLLAGLMLLTALPAFVLNRLVKEDLALLHAAISSRLRAVRPRRDPKDLPGDSDLEKHVRYFSGGREIIRAALATIYGKLRALGIPAFMAAGTYLGAHASFSRKTQKNMTPREKRLFKPDFLDIYTPRVMDAWIPTHTGVYGPDGNINMREFDRIFAEFAGGRDYVTEAEVARMREANRLRARTFGASWLKSWIGYFATKRQFKQLFMIAPDRMAWENGRLVPAISRAQLLYWYQGGLRYDIAQEHDSAK